MWVACGPTSTFRPASDHERWETTVPDLQIEVIVQIAGTDVRAGDLWAHRRGNAESATFAYDRAYLASPDAYALDPALPLVDGPLQTPERRKLFGALTDCAPDRWGRRLMLRGERHLAREEERAERSFGEVDYLLGARDDMRQGALRFRRSGTGTFLAADRDGVPLLVTLPELLSSSERVERDEETDEDLLMLQRGGSSLGGARPKAHVIDEDGTPAIAKFPSPRNDDWDVMRWEAVASSLARSAGIRTAPTRLLELDGRSVLLVSRFDRSGDRRIGYASAMTMLGAADGETRSYLEIAEAIEENSVNVDDDLAELWRRIAFSILISNTDDHLRNHGFLRTSTAGWSLAPAFDVNPDPDPGPKQLSTAVDFTDTAARIETALETAPYFGLDGAATSRILGEVSTATSGWRDAAAATKLSKKAIEQMAPAFEHEQQQIARELAAG